LKKKNNKEILRLFWRTSSRYKWRRNLSISIATLIFCVNLFVIPLIIAAFLDTVQHGNLEDSTIWWLVGSYAAAQLWAEVIGWRLVLYLTWTFETAMQRDLYERIFSKLAHESMHFHSNKFGGSLVSQANKLSGAIERFWDTIIWSVLPVMLSVIGSVTILWFISWRYSLFLAILSILFGVAVFFGSRRMVRFNEAEAAASNKVSGNLADTISNILAVKTSGAEKQEIKTFNTTTSSWRKASLATMGSFLKVSTVYSSISGAVRIGALVFAVLAAKNDMISIASIYLIVTYTASVAQNLWNMNGIMRSYNRVMGDALEMTTILDHPMSIINTSTDTMKITHGAIDMNSMTFTHDEGDGATLFRDFNLTIKPGEKVGLVGPSGSGKTSLTKLLLRLSDIDSGSITIDGQAINNVTQESLRTSIAYVPQEPLLFHRTIRENIAYGRPSATQKEIETAAKKAGAYTFITELTDGFDTLVGERGIKLSGGQRQRIAIARAILKDAPILVLDEATSALDSESEKLIQDSLDDLMKNRTSIVIAHRLSTIAKLDRIIVLDKGSIIEDGSHDELLKKKGVYARLWSHQSGGFIEE
jgi:ATP-binding cassette subfamily B protein